MPFSDSVGYMSVLNQMYGALYELNIEPDFVPASATDFLRYKVILVPPLYSASDEVLQRVSDYVKGGGQVVMAFKSGFTNQYSTVRDTMQPGGLRAAAGIHYQEFTNLAAPVRLTPDPYHAGDQNTGSVWEEFLMPDTAEVVTTFDHAYWHFPAITRNRYGNGALTYEGTVLSDVLQREVVRGALKEAGLTGPDQALPATVKVRHGRNGRGKLLHYYFNFSGTEQTMSYPYGGGTDVLTDLRIEKGQQLRLKPWDLAIVMEQ